MLCNLFIYFREKWPMRCTGNTTYNMVHCSPVFAQFFLFSFINLCRDPVFTLTPLLCIKNIYYCIFYDYNIIGSSLFFLPLTLFYACLHLYVIFAISSTCQPATFSPLLPFNPTLLNNVMRLGSVTWSITPPGVPGILNSHRLTLPTTVLCRIYFYCTAP